MDQIITHPRRHETADPATTLQGTPQQRPIFSTRNPATGERGRSYQGHSPKEAEAIAASTRAAFEAWRTMSFEKRGALMRSAADVLRRRRDEFARLMAQEMGKPIAAGRAEIERCIFNCEHFAARSGEYLAREPVAIEGTKAFVNYAPLGVVLAVMPWNFPFSQVSRFAAPTLMAGNGALLKHASLIPGCALAIEQVFREAGFPEHLFRTLLIPSSGVKAIIDSEHVAAVSLTGSVEAAGASRRPLVRRSRSACSSSAGRTPTSCWRMLTFPRRPSCAPPPACLTVARAAPPPSASS